MYVITKLFALVVIHGIESHTLHFHLSYLCNFAVDEFLRSDGHIQELIQIMFEAADLWAQQINLTLIFSWRILSSEKLPIQN